MRNSTNENIRHDTTVFWVWRYSASSGVAPVLEQWGMWISSWLPLIPGSLRTGMVVCVRFQSMDQIGLFKNYSHSIRLCAKKKKRNKKKQKKNNYTKNVNMNVQWTQFSWHKITLEGLIRNTNRLSLSPFSHQHHV